MVVQGYEEGSDRKVAEVGAREIVHKSGWKSIPLVKLVQDHTTM
jgi:hypothetical protein